MSFKNFDVAVLRVHPKFNSKNYKWIVHSFCFRFFKYSVQISIFKFKKIISNMKFQINKDKPNENSFLFILCSNQIQFIVVFEPIHLRRKLLLAALLTIFELTFFSCRMGQIRSNKHGKSTIQISWEIQEMAWEVLWYSLFTGSSIQMGKNTCPWIYLAYLLRIVSNHGTFFDISIQKVYKTKQKYISKQNFLFVKRSCWQKMVQ